MDSPCLVKNAFDVSVIAIGAFERGVRACEFLAP